MVWTGWHGGAMRSIQVNNTHRCGGCGAFYVPYDQDVPCPQCGRLEKQRCDFVARAVAATTPGTVLDLGCNTGDYAAVALEAGAGSVIGAEADPATAHLAFRRAQEEKLRFLPVVQDAANPSPSQGWREAERPAFTDRVAADFLLALAVVHHLAIGRNIPLEEAVRWIEPGPS